MSEYIDRIETLTETRRSEAIDILANAFSNHPMFPPKPTGRRSHLLAVAILDAFADAPDATLFGISRDGELVCVAFAFRDGYTPRGLTLAWFLWRMVKVFGLRMYSTMAWRVKSDKSSGDEQRLELILLGTRNGCQGQGLGRKMLRHLFDVARERGYAFVVLEVAKQTPAFGLYLSEGFEVEKEVALPTMAMCIMRRPLNSN
ncbi:MAG: GNAT family N-acetyltransferase [Leptolyngbya sp. SIOISBB]|nr:GNAT family N-acetyltransferase [Leptolyngbya sp. SIOISBB]